MADFEEDFSYMMENTEDFEDILGEGSEEDLEEKELDEPEDLQDEEQKEFNITNEEEVFQMEEKKSGKKIPDEERISWPFLTKYEKARILGIRVKQISEGAPVFINTEGKRDLYEIAMEELSQKKIPLSIKRYFPNGDYEEWKLSELSM